MTTIRTSSKTSLATIALVLFTVHPLLAQSCGSSCCGGRPATAVQSPGLHDGHAVATAGEPAPVPPGLQGAARDVFTNYLTVHSALANDSLDKVGSSAEALAKAIRNDPGKSFPTEIAEQAEKLAGARDLGAARKSFQALSHSLVHEVKAGNVPVGIFVEMYCPMAKSSWLQTDKRVRNPYFGRAMLSCGTVKT